MIRRTTVVCDNCGTSAALETRGTYLGKTVYGLPNNWLHILGADFHTAACATIWLAARSTSIPLVYTPDISGISPRLMTLSVAASTASEATKKAADYVCDGSADGTAINYMITKMLAEVGYGCVALSEGTHYIDTPVLIGGNTELRGQGRDATILSPKSGVDCNLVVIGDGSSYLNKAAISHMTLDGVIASHATGSGIYVRNGVDQCFGKCLRVQNFPDYGVYGESTALTYDGGMFLEDIAFDSGGGKGSIHNGVKSIINFKAGGQSSEAAFHISNAEAFVSHGHMQDMGSTPTIAIDCYGSSQLRLTNVMISDAGHEAVRIRGGGHHNILNGLIIYGFSEYAAGRPAINMDDCTDFQVLNCNIQSKDAYNPNYGIYWNTSTAVRGVIMGNIVRGTYSAGYLSASITDGVLEHNVTAA